MTKQISNSDFNSQIVELLKNARQRVVQTVNHTMVLTYFEIGRMIVEEQQQGEDRAEYGKELLKGLSKVLTKNFGKGFSVDSLERMRRFYLVYENSATVLRNLPSEKSATVLRISENEKSETLSRNSEPPKSTTPLSQSLDGSNKAQTLSTQFKLSWSHYLTLIRMDDEAERSFYEIESANYNWN